MERSKTMLLFDVRIVSAIDHTNSLGGLAQVSPRQTTPANDFSGKQLGDYGWSANSSGPGNAPCGNAFGGIATRLPWTTSVSIATAPDVWPAAVAAAVVTLTTSRSRGLSSTR